MSDRLKGVFTSKWTGLFFLGVGTVAAAGGGIALAVYLFRRHRQSSTSASIEQPMSPAPQPVHEVMQMEITSNEEASAAPPLLGTGSDETDFFEETTTYNEMYVDIENSLKSVFDNSALHAAFIQYIETSTSIVNRLKSLLEYLNQYEDTLKANQRAPQANADVQRIADALSTNPASKQQEVQVLIALIAAMQLFPPHIVKKAGTLALEKRQTLVNLIRSTPNVDKHVYMNKGPYEDPDLQPFMTRMGFSLPSYQSQAKLMYTASEDDDKLSAGLYLLLGTAKSS